MGSGLEAAEWKRGGWKNGVTVKVQRGWRVEETAKGEEMSAES